MPIPAPAFFARMNETQRLVASIAVIAVLGAALVVFWVLGLRRSHVLSTEVADAGTKLKAAEKTLADFPNALRRYRESLSEDRRLTQLLPDHNALDRAFQILAEIEEQAGKTGNDADFTLLTGKAVQKPATGKPAAPQDFEELTVEIEAAGSWSGLVSFLDGVEHADRLMTVKSFKTTGVDKVDPARFTYKIVLTLYKLAAPAPAQGAKK